MKFVKWGVIFLALILITIFILPGVGATQNNPPSDNNLCDNGHGSGTCNVQQNNPQCDHDHDYCDWHGDDDWCKNHQQGKNLVSIKNATIAATDLVSDIPGSMADFADWNGATVVKNTTYYDMSGVESAYSFNVTVNGQYDGYIMISATRDNYPLLEFSKGVTPDKDAATLLNAQQLAQSQITDPRFVLGEGQPIYLGATFFDMAYPVEINNTRSGVQQPSNTWILVDLIEKNIVNQSNTLQLNATERKELEQSQQQKIAEANAEWDAIDNAANSGQVTTAAKVLLADQDPTAYKIENVPNYLWHWGCSPTSASMILGYWRDQGLTQLPADNGNIPDYGDPLNLDLAEFMGTTYYGDGICEKNSPPDCGSTSVDNIPSGINKEFNSNGITSWSASNDWWFLPDSFNTDETEINNGYPFELSMQGGGYAADVYYTQSYGNHSVAVIGYDISGSDQYLIIHDTWDITSPHLIRYNNWRSATDTKVEPTVTYTITASAGSNGVITPAGSVTVPAEISKTFTISPDSGYVIDDVLVDGISKGAIRSYTFNDVTSSHTISATFKQNLPAIVPLCQAGTPFDSTKYAQNTPQSDPMIFTCNWDGNGQVYISGNENTLTGVYADDGFTINIQPSGATFDAAEHWAHQHPILEITSGMTPGSNTMTLIVQNWQGLSMSYGSITGIGVDQTPWIIEVNTPTNSVAAAKVSTATLPSFISITDNGLIVNGTLVKT